MADESARVLIVAPSLRDTTAIRLRDELAVLGFDVVLVQADSAATNLSEAAHAAGASAVARVESWPPEILLWVGDRATTSDETLHVSESLQGKVESELLALRAVELLRGRLLPVPVASSSASAPAPSAEPPVPSAPLVVAAPAPAPSASVVPEKPRPKPIRPPVRREKLSVFAGPAMFASPGGLSPAVHLAFAARFPLVHSLSAETWGMLPLTSGTVKSADGEMALRLFFLGAGLAERVTALDNPFVLSIGAGIGPMLLSFDGQSSNAAYSAVSNAKWAGFAYGRLGLGIRVHPMFRLRFDGLVGPVFPEPVLRIVGREVAHLGRPAVFLTLGAEMTP